MPGGGHDGRRGGEWKKGVPHIPAATWVAGGERPIACTATARARIGGGVPQAPPFTDMLERSTLHTQRGAAGLLSGKWVVGGTDASTVTREGRGLVGGSPGRLGEAGSDRR
jgi:hypothetical protein